VKCEWKHDYTLILYNIHAKNPLNNAARQPGYMFTHYTVYNNSQNLNAIIDLQSFFFLTAANKLVHFRTFLARAYKVYRTFI
jgi:hypothetical protein